VPITPAMAKTIEDSAYIITGLLLEEDGKMKLAGKQLFEVKGYEVELTAKVVKIPFPEKT